jgi:hypothetical protein
MASKSIDSLAGYLSAVNAVLERWSKRGELRTAWFRGTICTQDTLVPARYREPFVRLRLEHERELMLEFKRVAPSLRRGLPAHTRHIDWLAVAQHHGLPTRLLDWTESSLAALFFAVEQTVAPDREACPGVWMLNPDWLNRRAEVAQGVLVLTDQPENEAVDRRWGALEGDDPGRDPIAIRPVQLADRVAAQSGVFTLFGTEQQSLDSLSDAGDNLARINIAPSALPAVQQELRLAGVTAVSLFPDLDGLSRHLRGLFAVRALAGAR